ncbi:MAG: primosomal protein N', partial [Sandaracinaceae bacterium]|nr:primosomal protein N' [Sandaracinaceae bacterium]
VVLADQSLAFPDFRASERTFQLLSQVAGRAGRGERAGHVIFQTFQPRHPSILAAERHDYDGFYAAEVEERRGLLYAPFGRLVAARSDAPDERRAREAIDALAERAREQLEVKMRSVEVLGPAPAPIKRLRNRFRFRLLLRSADRRALRKVARAVAARVDEGFPSARAHVDVDPVSML